MVGYHGITGWSGGGRRPLTYNLMPGQMRSTRVNVFPTIQNISVCHYADPCQNCDNDSGMPKWLQWMMGGGMVMQMLGGIISGFTGGGGSAEGAGGASKKDVDAELDLKSIKDIYGKDYTITKFSNGTLRATPKKGGDAITANSPMELLDALDKAGSKTTTQTTTSVDPALKKLADDLGITITTDNPPKYKFGDNEYASLKEAIQAANSKPAPAAPTVAASNPTETVPRLFNDVTGKTTEQVLADFKTATRADAVKIETIGNGGITITNLHDPGTRDKAGSITISKAQLSALSNRMGTTSLGKYAGQDVFAENLDGYLRIKVGSQTYIVGKADDNKYTGYQFNDGNVTGYNEKNPELS